MSIFLGQTIDDPALAALAPIPWDPSGTVNVPGDLHIHEFSATGPDGKIARYLLRQPAKAPRDSVVMIKADGRHAMVRITTDNGRRVVSEHIADRAL